MDFSQESLGCSQDFSQNPGTASFFLPDSEEEDGNSLEGWDLISGLPALKPIKTTVSMTGKTLTRPKIFVVIIKRIDWIKPPK